MADELLDDDMERCAPRAREATAAGAQAFARLLTLAERSDSGQIARVDLFELRAVDVAISDDMLLCLDALRWGKADLFRLVPDGDSRVRAVIPPVAKRAAPCVMGANPT